MMEKFSSIKNNRLHKHYRKWKIGIQDDPNSSMNEFINQYLMQI